MPLYAVRTKVYLKSQDLILLDSGPQLRGLLPGCRRLKADGFKVHVLYGGIAGWRQAGGKIAGLAPSSHFPLLAPREFLLEYGPRRWEVLHVRSKMDKSETPADSVPGEKAIELADAKRRLSEMVGEIQGRRGGTAPGPFIAVIADDPAQYARLAQWLNGKERGIYFITGGMAAYGRERTRLHAIEGKRVFKLQQTASCSR